ncbi:MAG: polysaccharide deacetylase family protein [Calditrichaeota bacterium]|nr:polysaccharide deacetylase family protein [Calditrichota bacterium]
MQALKIPIINYHKVDSRSDIGITARHPRKFTEDLQIIRDLGFKPITFVDLLDKRELPDKPVIITFDDGYKSVIDRAFPIMERFEFPGVVFVPTDYIGKTNDWDVQFGNRKFEHLSAAELVFLKNHGFEIGSHGCSHRSFVGMGTDLLSFELSESKKVLETLLGTAVYSVSYPFGRFNRLVLNLTKKSGYRFGAAALYFSGNEKFNGFTNLTFRRFNVYRPDSPKTLKKKLEGALNTPVAYRDWLIQKGSLATILWQKMFKQGSVAQ